MDTTWRLGWRPALNGLRGIAVALVVAGHLDLFGTAPAAGVGVTVFFVLSGFLITTLLTDELAAGGIDRGAFYLRRARRLLPALIVMLGIIVIGSRGDAQAVTGGQVFAALFYVADFAQASGRDLGLLAHTWSLAVEEQFYLVWPLVLVVFRRRLRLLGWLCAATAVLVVVHRAQVAGVARVRYSADTRADAILAGSALALGFRVLPRVTLRWALFGGGLVGWACVLPDKASYTVAAVGGLLLVGWAGRCKWSPGRALTWLGDRSYGIYLWHVPVNAMLYQHALTSTPTVLSAGMTVAMSFGAAALSWRYVETPFRHAKMTDGFSALSTSHVEPSASMGPRVLSNGCGA